MSVRGRRAWSIGVVIPAQNEAGTIVDCVQSVLAAADHSHCHGSIWIVVVADGCEDETAELARRTIGPFGQTLEIDVNSPGMARRAGATAVLDHFRGIEPDSIWLANTDADSRVARDWIDVQLRLADQGVAGVAGIVHLAGDGPPHAAEVHRATYEIRDDGTHPHVHGANIAVRGDAYLDVGGWSELRLAEDHCLWNRVRARGWRVASPVTSIVVTSARLEGRASGGFADDLKAKILGLHARN